MVGAPAQRLWKALKQSAHSLAQLQPCSNEFIIRYFQMSTSSILIIPVKRGQNQFGSIFPKIFPEMVIER